MSQFKEAFYKYQDLIYKVLLLAVSASLIIYFFPKSGRFQYDIQKGFPWTYENLYAAEDFAVLKSEEALNKEQETIRANAYLHFDFDEGIKDRVMQDYETRFNQVFTDTSFIRSGAYLAFRNSGKATLETLYNHGIVAQEHEFNSEQPVFLTKGAAATQARFGQIHLLASVPDYLDTHIVIDSLSTEKNRLLALLYDIVTPNVTYNETLTEQGIQEELDKLSAIGGIVTEGSRIISRGDLIEGEALQKLLSLKAKYETENFSESRYNWILLGYVLLVSLALVMLLLFIKTYRPQVYTNNTKVTFVFFNVVVMILLTVVMVKYKPEYIYAVPLCILPLIIKAFFDSRLGLFTLLITVLLLGFIVPNNFEYFFLQIMAGIVTILTTPELYKRANLFISVGQITLVYIIAYFAFNSIHEGGLEALALENFGLFVLAGLATLFVQPLIYVYEKLFGLVSDVSLLELSDTNSKVLKELADTAPGTFHHSLNVANLCEAAANEIGANAMLVRVGALYHDIGKMNNPGDFTENQSNAINIHDELSPDESARIIIDHVIHGIELARKYKLPDRIIDFIRTHHGTSLVRYFYQKAKDKDDTISEEAYRYPGPLPFSKETAILMMADSVEAASKSLKNPTTILIDTFVDKIITGQKDDNQFSNSDITFKEIELIKKVLKRKLANIYHLRVEYPEYPE